MGNLARILILQVAQTRQMACGASSRISRIAMTEDGDLAQGTRNAIKVGICLLLVGQVLVNAYLYYVHGRLASTRTDPRVGALLIPGFIYLMATEVPEVLK